MEKSTAEQKVQAEAEEPQNTSAAVPSTPQPSGMDSAEAGNLERVRSILFGSQMQDNNRRFVRLEERLVKESSDLREEFRRRHDALEAYVRKELESLNDRLKAEQSERADSARKFSRDLKDMGESFEKKTDQLAEQIATNHRDLHELILEQSKSLSEDLRQKYTEISSTLDRQVQEIRTDKTDRSALAALFTEMAMRLNNEWQLPGTDIAS